MSDDLERMIANSPAPEDAYWNSLDDDQAFENTAGNPPYDVAEVASFIIDKIPDRRRLLDLGCGMGRLTNHLARVLDIIEPHRDRVHGLDISQQMLFRATIAKPSNAMYWHGNGRGFPPGLFGPFTGAYSIAMFQHIPPDAMWGYLRLVYDHLEPGCPFLFTIAVGEADQFLNHQIADPSALAKDLMQIFESVMVYGPDDRGWTWVEAWKES